ncbi:hypothetical protein ACQJBY_034370 [Aegilops geniculata]
MNSYRLIFSLYRIGSSSNHNATFLRRFHNGGFRKLQLINEVKRLYNSNDMWREHGFLAEQIDTMVSHIHEGYSSFHPRLVYKVYKYGRGGMTLQEHFTLERQDELGYCCARRPLINAGDWPCMAAPSLSVDVLLLKALANILRREFLVIRNNLPPRLNYYNEMLGYHERFWDGQSGVEKIVCVDLSHSIRYVYTERLWNTLKCLHNLGVISHILKEFLSLPIYNADTNLQIPHSNCIPLIGELSDVLLHLFLQHQFDREVLSRYEGVLYTRWDTNVLLASTRYDSYHLDRPQIQDILRYVNLTGSISVIERGGGGMLVNPEKSQIFLSADGDVSIPQLSEAETEYDSE